MGGGIKEGEKEEGRRRERKARQKHHFVVKLL